MRHLGSVPSVHLAFGREWERLRCRPQALRHAAGWHIVTGPLSDLHQIVEMTERTMPDAIRETTLRRLVELARDDDLAARVILQRLLPDLVRIHQRWSWRRRGACDVGLGDLLATGWTVIRTYNPDRRPARLASSLVSDIEYREYRAHLRRLTLAQLADPCRFDEVADVGTVDPTVELAALVADPRVALDETERDLLRRLMSGRTAIDIARDLGVTPRTLRNRRDRIVLRLREAALAA